MSDNLQNPPIIVRTERGLTIAGTRTTIYDVMGYLKEEWPAKLIQQWLNLTDAQINGTLDYISQHQAEVEDEYRYVLQRAQEIRAYWQDRNRERFAAIANMAPKPGEDALYDKIQARKAELGLS